MNHKATPVSSVSANVLYFDSIPFEEPEFLIFPYVPLGKITIIQADSGVGKTALACKLAACVSRGMPMQGAPCMLGKSLILSVEDDPSTLRGRIEASGGDLTRCAFLGNAYDLTFTSSCIEQAVKDHDVRLLVFDPLQAFLGSGVDMHRANETRPVMAHLAEMAKRCKCAVVIISHMAKGTAGGKAIYRALGSVDIPAASRSVLHVERNPADRQQCVIVHTKSSNAEAGTSILYRIGERGGVAWEGYSSLSYEDLQAAGKEKEVSFEDDPVAQAVKMLLQDNPQGVFVTWEQLDRYAVKALGFSPCGTSKEWSSRLKAMKHDFSVKAGVIVEPCKQYNRGYVCLGKSVPGTGQQERGLKITPCKPVAGVQTEIRQ